MAEVKFYKILAKPADDLLKKRYNLFEDDLALCRAVNNGDFLEWVCKNYSKGNIDLPEGTEELKEYLGNFDLLRKKRSFNLSRDINDYTPKDLENLMGREFGESNAKKRLLVETLTFTLGPWSLYVPKNPQQLAKLSGGSSTDRFGNIYPETKWCTTSMFQAEAYFSPENCLIIRKDGRNYAQIDLEDWEMKDSRDGDMVVHGLCLDLELNEFLRTLPYKFYFRTPSSVDYSKLKNLSSSSVTTLCRFIAEPNKQLEKIILDRLATGSLSSVNELISYGSVCLKGEPFQVAQDLLASQGTPEQLAHYSIFSLKSRWPEVEHRIFEDPVAASD